ncbi:putative RNA methyltransferase [Pseudomonas matsuisoli]|uniref:SAM-dependent methyltransferase n=1 Tax=Pseudomonas matsuisoli TaxID=1515666 RepID=A0A917USG9_9PSED|nr:methyltransferase domain-containing protein [Pseudomonas matsuisoli]GGJ82003.1 SAM-dependent methyltransferase [Pseudomonas matsuisoli]
MLICPICREALSPVENGAACTNSHRFDRARQGYLNLLPVQHKNSRAPGDNSVMVEARRRYLQAGHYAPVAERLATIVRRYRPSTWVDIGCGEGYYTGAVAAELPHPGTQGYALDISREAVRIACRRAPTLEWLVASMARIPLQEDSCDLALSVFSPLDWPEAKRILAPGGGLLRVGPLNAHLIELRAMLYEDVRPYDDTKHLESIPDGMRLEHSETLTYTLPLPLEQSRADLLAMTPHGWRANAARRAHVLAAPIEVTVAMRYDWITQQRD